MIGWVGIAVEEMEDTACISDYLTCARGLWYEMWMLGMGMMGEAIP